jgi:hypothetical protein
LECHFKRCSTTLPEQFNPFPSKPCLQEQINDPSVLLHVALFPHGDDRHSLTTTIINVDARINREHIISVNWYIIKLIN